MTHSIETQIAEVKRELVMRRRNYPRWVATRKMTASMADLQIGIMGSVLETLQHMRQQERSNDDDHQQAPP